MYRAKRALAKLGLFVMVTFLTMLVSAFLIGTLYLIGELFMGLFPDSWQAILATITIFGIIIGLLAVFWE